MESLKERVFIVTGASSGIGFATTQTLLRWGAKVYACDRSSFPPGQDIDASNLEFFQGDLSKPDTISRIVKGCVARFGEAIDGLLNVAGIMDTNSSADTLTNEMWERNITINLTAPVYLMREVIPYMLKAGSGSIVNVTSYAGLSGAVAGIAYTAAKHGLVGATKNVAWRFADEGIRCNAICPGGVATNIAKSINMADMDEAGYARLKPIHDVHSSWSSQKGMSTPQDQANILVFLVSDMSKEVSGAIIPVDRAWSTI